MNVAELQQLLSGVAQFADAAGGSKTTIAEISRAVECLEPFKNVSLADFNDFLRRADECVRTGQWPEPGKKTSARAGGAKAPKISIAEAAQKFLALKERATDPSLENHFIDSEIDSFESLKKEDLIEVAKQVGRTLPSKGMTKPKIIAEFKRVIKELKESHAFNQYRPATAGATNP